jgi:hypothetical protein
MFHNLHVRCDGNSEPQFNEVIAAIATKRK